MKFFFFTPPAFSESLYFLFSYRSLYFSFRYFLVISRRISNNLFFDQLPGFVCFLCSGFFRFEKWNETYVFGGLYLLYLESFKYEPFRLLCFVLSFFLMSLLYTIQQLTNNNKINKNISKNMLTKWDLSHIIKTSKRKREHSKEDEKVRT